MAAVFTGLYKISESQLLAELSRLAEILRIPEPGGRDRPISDAR